MDAVTVAELAKRVVDLLGLKPGSEFELAKTQDGSVLIKRVDDS